MPHSYARVERRFGLVIRAPGMISRHLPGWNSAEIYRV
jgi:hypothetical protein